MTLSESPAQMSSLHSGCSASVACLPTHNQENILIHPQFVFSSVTSLFRHQLCCATDFYREDAIHSHCRYGAHDRPQYRYHVSPTWWTNEICGGYLQKQKLLHNSANLQAFARTHPTYNCLWAFSAMPPTTLFGTQTSNVLLLGLV